MNRKSILIVDDNPINRKMLSGILATDYDVLEAVNGKDALDMLVLHDQRIACVMLDLVMPVMDGYTFLQTLGATSLYKNLPVIVTTGSIDADTETRALSYGAWDFVSKPYKADVIRFRLKNAIDRSELSAFQQLKFLAEFDTLTGIYNNNKFSEITGALLAANPNEQFVLLRLDIYRFQLVNAFFGAAEGDRLLQYLGEMMRTLSSEYAPATFGRIEADVFALCCPFSDEATTVKMLQQIRAHIKAYNISFDIVPTFGLYIIRDRALPVEIMLDRANLATKKAKGHYLNNYAFYTDDMGLALEKEQELINEMSAALEGNQFFIQIQPKYDLHTNLPAGGEALVRWRHPTKGLISPGEFIPVFEKNGMIIRIDCFVWEKVCALLSKWLREGIAPNPISVNVSRVNLYNPQFVDHLCSLIDKYGLPASLLQLELTESAYTDNPAAMKQIIASLRSKGFSILMDDFGSGYSSLNILKDIEVDILKIDTQFLSATEIPGRGENIIASVVRMAKWLGIPTVAEGAEHAAQIEFLRSIDCEYVQGYYFSKPLPVNEYEALAKSHAVFESTDTATFDTDSLWASNSQMQLLFSNATQAAGIYEFDGRHVECIRVNNAFTELFGYEDAVVTVPGSLDPVVREYRATVLSACKRAIEKQGVAECDYLRHAAGEKTIWVNSKIKYINSVGSKHILLVSLFDISAQKEIENELFKYRSALSVAQTPTNKMLVVDDVEANRAILRAIFEKHFTVLEAANGQEAFAVLENNDNHVDIILLDMMMPVMDGSTFLAKRKQMQSISAIPVVMITADDTPEQQINTLAMGANDYIVKPFVAEIVIRRVSNVLESNRRFRVMLKEYRSAVQQAQTDPLTHLLNRTTAQDAIEKELSENASAMHALVMIDIDAYKSVNDTHGHSYGDMVLMEFSEKLKIFFRTADLLGRMGGDEFCVLMKNISTPEAALEKCYALCRTIDEMTFGDEKIKITCSVGIATSDNDSTFEKLYRHADAALYDSKRMGKNRATLYGSSTSDAHISNWVNKEWLIDALDDAVSIIDTQTHAFLYASRASLRLCGMESFSERKCYEVLYGRSTPCPHCIEPALSDGTFKTRKIHSEHLEKELVVKDKLLHYQGRPAHLQVLTDVTDTQDGS